MPDKKPVGCDEPQRLFSAIAQAEPDERTALQDEAVGCGEPMAEVCRKRLRNPASSVGVLSAAATLLAKFDNPDDSELIADTWATIGPQ